MTKPTFKHVFLIGRPGIPEVLETLHLLTKYLTTLAIEFSIEKNTADLLKEKNADVIAAHELLPSCDLIIVVGGDGSLLQASHIAIEHDLPVLGINRGRLGFLTDIHPDELAKIGEVLQGQYQQESRFFLQATLHHGHEVIHQNLALNDIVMHYGRTPHMIEFEIHVNQQFVCSQRADGLIIATPTGSTAYALSGGGPILHPHLNALVIVPMFPHTLSSRPIVIDANTTIEVRVGQNNVATPYVSCDGRERIALPSGGKIEIKKYHKPLRLIHPMDYSYFAALREKLGWEKSTNRVR